MAREVKGEDTGGNPPAILVEWLKIRETEVGVPLSSGKRVGTR